MTFKLFAISVLLAISSVAQTQTDPTTFKLPTYVIAGGAYNQYAANRANAFVSAVAPVSSQAGVYESTTADVLPIKKTDASGKTVYVLQSTVRQGIHKIIYSNARIMLLMGGDVGAAFSQASTGLNAAFSGSVTITPVYQLSEHWAVAAPVRGLYLNGVGWGVVPEIGVVWKP